MVDARHSRRLDATLGDRVRALLHRGSGNTTLLLRRIAATVLLLLACALALRSYGPAANRVPVLVAEHDLTAGSSLSPADVSVRRVPSTTVPDGALRKPAEVRGRVLAGPARRGAAITDVRLVDAALAAITVGDEARAAVPIRLSDPAVAELLYPGRRVDVIAASRSDEAEVLAERAPVIAVRPPEERGDDGRLVVVGLPRQRAPTVASAALTSSVTVTLR